MQIFGFEIKRKSQAQRPSVVPPSADDGATVVNPAAGYYAQVMSLDAIIKNENDLIRRYREIALYPDTDSAIEDIANEAIISDEDEEPIRMTLEDVKVSNAIKAKIQDEFKKEPSMTNEEE